MSKIMDKFKQELDNILKKNFVYSRARERIIEEVVELCLRLFKKRKKKDESN